MRTLAASAISFRGALDVKLPLCGRERAEAEADIGVGLGRVFLSTPGLRSAAKDLDFRGCPPRDLLCSTQSLRADQSEMRAKLRVWVWWLVVAAAVVLAVREVTWLGDRTVEHRARRHPGVVAKPADPAAAAPQRRHMPIPISGFGPL